MQLLAAVFLLALSFGIVAVDHLFGYPGLAAFGGMLITFVGVRISRSGLTQITDAGNSVAVNFGDIDAGILIMILGAIVLVQRLNKIRKERPV